MTQGRRSEHGAGLVEYALGLAVFALAIVAAVNYVQQQSTTKLNARAPTIGTPTESNALFSGPGAPPQPPPLPPGSGAATVHATGMTYFATKFGSPPTTWSAAVTVTVTNSTGEPWSGVTVSGSFTPTSGSATVSCVTDATGACTLQVANLDYPTVTSTTFTLVALAGAGITYDPTANGISSITVPRP